MMDPVALQARRRPDAPAVITEEGAVVTYGELDGLVEEGARVLVEAFMSDGLHPLRSPEDGLQPPRRPEDGLPPPRRPEDGLPPPRRPEDGRRRAAEGLEAGAPIVAVRFGPSLQAVVAIHAVWRSGAVLLPLNQGWTDRRLERILPLEWTPQFILNEGEGAGPGVLERREAPTVERGGAARSRRATVPGRASVDQPRVQVPMAVVLTSGTDGLPTAVPISRENLELSARGSAARLSLTEDDVWLWALSPAHVGGLALVHRAMCLGCAVQPLPRFEGEAAAARLSHPGFSHASLVPVMLQDLLDAWGERPLPPQLRCLLLGGAATPRGLVERAVAAGFPVALTYGLTHATSQVATNPPDAVAQEVSSGGDLTVGTPLPGVSVDIVDPDARGVGGIRVRGGTVALPSSGPGESGGPYLDTGDLGVLDGGGRLRVVGRQSRRIISGGVNVEPGEVEEVLLSHPTVREVMVLGRPHPRWGEEVVAVIAENPLESGVQLPELLEYCRPLLPPAARPRAVRVVEALPRNANGKVDLAAVRALLQESCGSLNRHDAGAMTIHEL